MSGEQAIKGGILLLLAALILNHVVVPDALALAFMVIHWGVWVTGMGATAAGVATVVTNIR